tara:strand:- start:777 stop:1445 length:669 start_codon:yes stop_codon:yes gene_type:complete
MLTIIIPFFNYKKFLDRCLNSIYKIKNNKDYEVILIDDGSKEDISGIVKKYKCKYENFKFVRKSNGGLSHTINHGIKISKYDYICKIDPDDTVSEIYFDKIFQNISTKKLVYFFNYNLIEKNKMKKIDQSKVMLRSLEYPIGSTLVINKSVFNIIGNYGSKFFHMDDFATWLKIKKKINLEDIFFINEYLYNYHIHGENMSNKIIKKNITKIILFFALKIVN